MLDEAPGRVLSAITGLVRGYLSQSSKLYGVLEASEDSLYAFSIGLGASSASPVIRRTVLLSVRFLAR